MDGRSRAPCHGPSPQRCGRPTSLPPANSLFRTSTPSTSPTLASPPSLVHRAHARRSPNRRGTASRGGAAADRRRSWPRLLRPSPTKPRPSTGACGSCEAAAPLHSTLPLSVGVATGAASTAASELVARMPRTTFRPSSESHRCGRAPGCSLCPSIPPRGCLRPNPDITGDPLPCSGSMSRGWKRKVLAP
jgi:hypothetical protein